MVDIEAAVRYPLGDDDWLQTVGIGGGILLVNGIITFVGFFVAFLLTFVFIGFMLYPVIVIVSFLITLPVLGYGVRVLRATIRGEDHPPRFGDWGDLFKDGLYVIAIGLVYSLPLVIISVLLFVAFFGLAIVIGGAGSGAGGDPFAAGGSVLLLLGYFVYFGVVFLYSIAMAYVAPISLATYADEGDFRAAFSVDRIKRVGFRSEYAVPWVVAVVGSMVVNNVAGILVFLLVGFFIQFYVQVVVFRLFGLGYVDAMEADGADATDGTDAAEGAATA